jgi:hypothetical protein
MFMMMFVIVITGIAINVSKQACHVVARLNIVACSLALDAVDWS